MPADSQRAALKAMLLGPATAIVAWGVDQFTAGNQEAGAVAVAMGVAMYILYTGIQEYDMPYEEEIVSIIETASPAVTEDEVIAHLQEASYEAGDRIEDLSDTDDD